ncbi:MAG TPA: 23S rRNA (pseudouridine(1915)-N(3))-methyltransferase RlmH [Bacteroidaceae bacterium]|nr:23S rRNA (pseudouridine(1915)-N(3))-methyltransferase RlmH [Bacteroidaceae bacterium]
MKTTLLVVGKNAFKYIDEGVKDYVARINRFIPFNIEFIPLLKNTKNMNNTTQKELEGRAILKRKQKTDIMILLDDKGVEMTSIEMADWLGRTELLTGKRLLFIIGGPYGFSDSVYSAANQKISLSKMTFSHQIVRLIFTEQLYRALSILNGMPYHHE